VVLCANYILGRFGPDCDLKRFGMKIVGNGTNKIAKKRARVAVARKLAVLMLHLWKTGEVYDPLHLAKRHGQAGGDLIRHSVLDQPDWLGDRRSHLLSNNSNRNVIQRRTPPVWVTAIGAWPRARVPDGSTRRADPSCTAHLPQGRSA